MTSTVPSTPMNLRHPARRAHERVQIQRLEEQFGSQPQASDTYQDDFYGDEDDLGRAWHRANVVCAAVLLPLLLVFFVPLVVVNGWRESPVIVGVAALAIAWVAGVHLYDRAEVRR